MFLRDFSVSQRDAFGRRLLRNDREAILQKLYYTFNFNSPFTIICLIIRNENDSTKKR